MIEEFDKYFTLECDYCGHDSGEIFDEFMDAVEWKKERSNGWKSRKNLSGEWEDLCPDCR